VIGLSDHTLGVFPTIAGIAMGAELVEKHYTVDKSLPDSADHWLSIDPNELANIVDYARYIEVLRGQKEKAVFSCEEETRKYDKRSIVSATKIKKGQKITDKMITYKRPGTGIEPRDYKKVIGSVALKDIKEDTTLVWKMLKGT